MSFLSEPESSFSSSMSELPSGCRASLDSESAAHKLSERQFCRMRRDIAVLSAYIFIHIRVGFSVSSDFQHDIVPLSPADL